MKRKKSSESFESEEQRFLAAYDAAQFPHPSVAVDVALVTVVDGELQALLHRRSEHPAKGRWALPGGFIDVQESLDAAAARVLRDKAGLSGVFLEQLYTFGDPRRDPRTRVITVAYYGLVAHERLRAGFESQPSLSLLTLTVPWTGETGGPAKASTGKGQAVPLAFDHAEILGLVVKRLRGKLNYAPIGFQLLPSEFTLRTLQTVHETVLGRELNKDSFRRRMLASGQLGATGKRELEVGHRPAELYRFVHDSAV